MAGSVTGAILAHMAAHANLSPTRALPLLDHFLTAAPPSANTAALASCIILAAHTLAPPPHDQRTVRPSSLLTCCAPFLLSAPPPTARLIPSSLLLTFLTCNSAFARCTPQALQKRQFCPPRSKKKINFSKTERLDQAASAIACFSHDATSQPRTRSPHQVLPSRSLSQHFVFSPAMESHHVVQNNVLVFCFLHCHSRFVLPHREFQPEPLPWKGSRPGNLAFFTAGLDFAWPVGFLSVHPRIFARIVSSLKRRMTSEAHCPPTTGHRWASLVLDSTLAR